MDGYIKKSEAVDVIVKYPYDIAGKTATAIKMIEDLPSADVVPKSEVEKLYEVIFKKEDLMQKIAEERNKYSDELEMVKDNNEHLAVILEETKIELEAMRCAANSLKMHYEKAEAEVERLHGILLQFTDIVHKWGAKNNIDTSEISLVPILQEEADSIIKKANQAFAREIFALIYDRLLTSFPAQSFIDAPCTTHDRLFDMLDELQKKYTEGDQ